ncbi:hypothetical protein QBC46DRAFT_371464 [Diplogelasinospora grovesii]|uniref:Carrier domain-containing protein n=1 Tax=Diplogelasinospora grovesii TaxID=303347 RepID=A0AAN6NH70_9PEZI|nr:hypothetical protein QBC46DRAFT_371464 [Diplogelasinospora grovesii]
MGSLPLPTNAGQRLLPSLVDEIAASDPERVFFSVAKTKNPADGFQDITAKAFARAVNRCAWYIEQSLGRGKDFPTLTYMGPQDLVYAILIPACIKTGYKLLLNSPRNTLEAHLFLFEKTDCNVFLLPPNFPLPVIKQILAAREMRVVEVQGVQHWLQDDGPDDQVYPYNKSFNEAKHDPFVILHTSGSTGMPKPIQQSHLTITPIDAFGALPSLGYPPAYPAMCTGSRVYIAFPLFHCAGVLMLLPGPVYNGYTAILGPFPPSADVANGVHVYGNVQHSCLAPMTLIDLAKDPSHLENLGRLDMITFGGGPLPQAVGDLISTKTRLLSVLGTTECGVLPIQLCDSREDWQYMSFSPVGGLEYRHVAGDLYEQFIVRDPKLEPYQGIWGSFPDLKEWPMKDLYSKHPTKEGAWLHRGRADDIIVFSTGEKLNPVEMESIVSTNPVVKGALVAGQGQFQSALLVEAVNRPLTDTDREKLLGEIWPSVEAANRTSPSHGRILRDMIIFTAPEKPMARAGKGTVQRKMTINLYAAELEALYKTHASSSSAPNGTTANSTSNGHDASVQDTVKRIITTSTDIDPTLLTQNLGADLFELGLDSLQITVITRELNTFLSTQVPGVSVEARTVYANPSISALTSIVESLISGSSHTGTESPAEKMQRLYEQHSAHLPISARPVQPKSSHQEVVLLTGSTGSLGSYILDSLLKDDRVSKIYCLNRGPDSVVRQAKSMAARGLHQLEAEKTVFLDTDLSKPYLGLPTTTYKVLLGEVTCVVHNAWKVDFNHSLDSFSTQIAGVRRLIDFSSGTRFGARVFFISSISSVSNSPETRIPERVAEDWTVSEDMGYGQSKLVSERLLDTAAREADVPAIVCRVGQIAGPVTKVGDGGMWPKQEWIPSLIASSKHLGKLPQTLGGMERVDWIPVDCLGETIVELALHQTSQEVESEGGAVVYHTVNVTPSTWSKELVPAVVGGLEESLGGERKVEVVSLEDWVSALRESAKGQEVDVQKNPAIKLLDFFAGLSKSNQPMVLDTQNTAGVSETLKGTGPVQKSWMENWMRQWAF